jgi:hypothetical protein
VHAGHREGHRGRQPRHLPGHRHLRLAREDHVHVEDRARRRRQVREDVQRRDAQQRRARREALVPHRHADEQQRCAHREARLEAHQQPEQQPRPFALARRLADHDGARTEVEHVDQHLVQREVEGEHAQVRRLQHTRQDLRHDHEGQRRRDEPAADLPERVEADAAREGHGAASLAARAAGYDAPAP